MPTVLTRPLRADALIEAEAELCTLHASIQSARARMLAIIDAVDEAGTWALTGATSTAGWLTTLLDLQPCTAREHVRVARALRDLPQIAAAVADGSLSYSKARHVTRVATAANEADALQLAERHAASALPCALAAWQQQTDPDAHRRRQIADQSVTARTDHTGNRVITAVLTPERGATFESLIDAELLTSPSAPLPASADASDRPTLAQQRADALIGLCDRLVHAGASAPHASADASQRTLRPELVLHRRLGTATLLDGAPLPDAAVRYLSCDADLRIMTHLADGSPADVGRRHRLVTPRLRRLALERARDTCEHPGCNAKHYLDVHHIEHWSDGGRTDLANLKILCSYHHRATHDA